LSQKGLTSKIGIIVNDLINKMFEETETEFLMGRYKYFRNYLNIAIRDDIP
jgi:hypothetical protein